MQLCIRRFHSLSKNNKKNTPPKKKTAYIKFNTMCLLLRCVFIIARHSTPFSVLPKGIHCDRRGGGCRGAPGSVLGTDSGCIPYFGHGSGVDHFNSKSSAPPCQDQCVKTSTPYFRPFKADVYVMPGGRLLLK